MRQRPEDMMHEHAPPPNAELNELVRHLQQRIEAMEFRSEQERQQMAMAIIELEKAGEYVTMAVHRVKNVCTGDYH